MSSVFDALQLQRIAQAIEDGQAGATATATVNLDFSNVGDMTGATAGTAGTHGLVPAPAAGDQDKTLHGDGTWREDAVDLPQVFGSGSGSIITLTDAADYAASDLVIDIDPVQSGSGDPAPDNIRPISGWNEANITVDPNVTLILPVLESAEYYSRFFNVSTFTAKPNSEYYVRSNAPYLNNNVTTFIVCAYEETPLTAVYGVFGTELRITTKTSGKISVYWRSNAGDSAITITNIDDFKDGTYYLQITDHPTDGYMGEKYQITFTDGTDPLTVYGGTLDVVNGVLTVTKANIESYDGETLPGAWISDRDVYAEGTTPTTGAQVVYDLDTPITYQLTPTEVHMLLGTNNIWADTGDILTLEYIKADYNDLMQAVPKMKMPDYSAAIASGTYNLYDGFNYTAVKDCIIYIMIGCDSGQSYPSVSVNNNSLGYIWSNTSGIEIPLFIPLKAGDVLDVSATTQGNNWTENYIVFALN